MLISLPLVAVIGIRRKENLCSFIVPSLGTVRCDVRGKIRLGAVTGRLGSFHPFLILCMYGEGVRKQFVRGPSAKKCDSLHHHPSPLQINNIF